MICKKCGKEISDSAKFCAYCGSPVEAEEMPTSAGGDVTVSPETSEEIDYDATVVITAQPSAGPASGSGEPMPVDPVSDGEEPTPVRPASGGDEPAFVSPASGKDESVDDTVSGAMPVVPLAAPGGQQSASGAQNTGNAGPYPVPNVFGEEPKPKKSRKGLVFGVLAVMAVAVVAVIVSLARGLFGIMNTAERLVYLKDGELSAILDITAKDPVDVDIEKLRNEDGSYAYVYTKYSEDGKYLYYFSKADDGYGTLSRLQTDKLKKDKSASSSCITEIDSKVNLGEYVLVGNDSLVYKRKGDELWLYRGGETTKLADSVDSYSVTEDQKYIVYTEEDRNGEFDLYWMEISEKAKEEEIDSHVTSVLSADSSDFIVYSKSGKDWNDYYVAGVSKSPSLVAEDAYGVYSIENNSFYYQIPESRKLPLYDYVIDSSAESDAKAQEPNVRDHMQTFAATDAISQTDLTYYGSMEEFLASEASYYENIGLYEYYNYDKSDYYYYDNATGTWYGSYDVDSYNAALSEYEAAAGRNELRTELKQETVDQGYGVLYRYQNGKSESICENASYILDYSGKGIAYTKIDLESPEKSYRIEDISSASSLRGEIEGNAPQNDKSFYCYIAGSKEDVLDDFDTFSEIYLSEDGKTLVAAGNADGAACELIQYTVNSDGLGKGETITREGSAGGFHDSGFYYYENVSDDEQDLYCYDKNGEKRIAEDCHGLIFLADDGTVAGISDWDSGDGEGDLTVFGKDGKGEEIVKGVSGYRYLGLGTYLFMQDDDLYYLNKKGEKTRLAKDVEYFWYPGELPGTWM